MTPYWLDANVFINAAVNHYGMGFCPGFWDWIVHAHINGDVRSVDRVKDEITVVDTEVKSWASNLPMSFFAPSDAVVFQAYDEVKQWVEDRDCYPYARDRFLEKADPWLIAQAMVHGGTVVTHEIPAPEAKKSIKIPDVCHDLNVPWIDPFEMLRREQPRFILEH